MLTAIQRFSLDDGPGIRTTVFLKGCNLRCAWCHNPECISPKAELRFYQNRCTGCGACAGVCSAGAHAFFLGDHAVDRARCLACGRCAAVCPSGALALEGRRWGPFALLCELEKDRRYYESSGGGVTFSGGEPLLQLEFLQEMLALCREAGFSTAVDTAGNVPYEYIQTVLPWTDLFLYDIKAVTPQLHRRAAGADNRQILENLPQLLRDGGQAEVRIPVVREYNAAVEEAAAIADYLAALPAAVPVRLLPYHNYGAGKYPALGRTAAALRRPEEAELQRIQAEFEQRGLTVLPRT